MSEAATAKNDSPRLSHVPQLDGWRGISILAVLSTHMLPLGPTSWGLNYACGLFGMSVFFSLSGFLITSFLLSRPEVGPFLIRRLFRIVPLAYTYLFVVLAIAGAPAETWLGNLSFTINYNTEFIQKSVLHNSHFWSLCLELHFYLAISLIVGLAGRRGLQTIPAICVFITVLRVLNGSTVNIMTHLRVDEILSGATLALIYAKQLPGTKLLKALSPWFWLPLLLISCHPAFEPVMYLRPYFAALLVGSSLFQSRGVLPTILTSSALKYVATISYALYVIHPATMYGWLGTGAGWEKYLLKRPISFAIAFALAHLSTFHWEARWTALGRSLTTPAKHSTTPTPTPTPTPA